MVSGIFGPRTTLATALGHSQAPFHKHLNLDILAQISHALNSEAVRGANLGIFPNRHHNPFPQLHRRFAVARGLEFGDNLFQLC